MDAPAELKVKQDEVVLSRAVTLFANETIYVYAVSHLVLSRMPKQVQAELLNGTQPIGKILRNNQVPQHRILEPYELLDTPQEIAKHINYSKRVIKKPYTININDQTQPTPNLIPIMYITEYFPSKLPGLAQ